MCNYTNHSVEKVQEDPVRLLYTIIPTIVHFIILLKTLYITYDYQKIKGLTHSKLLILTDEYTINFWVSSVFHSSVDFSWTNINLNTCHEHTQSIIILKYEIRNFCFLKKKNSYLNNLSIKTAFIDREDESYERVFLGNPILFNWIFKNYARRAHMMLN